MKNDKSRSDSMRRTPAGVRRGSLHPIAAAAALLALSTSVAHAQQGPAAEGQAAADSGSAAPATVVVTGIRRSLDSSLDLKRESRGWVDGIVAEDIGKFPDTNLAESMQRISGVSIDRSIGEGSKVTVRGVGPDFNLVLLNGRQMPASSIGDTYASDSRAFDFANLASESIAGLLVYKTSRASSPTGGMGATINIKTARPLETRETIANFGIKGVIDQSNDRLPAGLKGKDVTPEISGIYSTVLADGMFGVSITGSYQKRDLGFNQAGVPNGWRAFHGDTNDWGTIPQPGTPGSERITNRPKATDVYSVPQNLLYSVNGIQRERTNGQLTLQFAPQKNLVATLDFTGSENKIATKRNELSAWFNFGPSSSSWTDGPVAGPKSYSEIIVPANSDIAMGGAMYATKNRNESTGLNLAWKPSNKMSFEFDAHHSSATSGADSPYGSNSVIGTASFNRGTTTANFTQDFPVLSIDGSQIDASKQLVTGSSFRNSYMRSVVDQAQFSGKLKFEDSSKLDFGLGNIKVQNRSAFANVQRDTWGGATSPADYPDSIWHADSISKYFSRINGNNSPALFNQFFTWDFQQVRDLAAKAINDQSAYLASDKFSTDRRTTEKSQSAYIEYSRQWEWGVPMGATVGVRYEKTDVTSTALVPIATGVVWQSNNEFSVQFGAPGYTTLTGSYKYFLPNLDFDADLNDKTKLRASFGETIGRPGWGAIQGGQTLDQLMRINGGTGSQGNPALKPLKSKNIDLALEYYYAKGSYLAAGYFHKAIDNFIGSSTVTGTPFNLHTPAGGALFNEAQSKGKCVSTDLTCIRNYIFRNYAGTNGVTRGADDTNGNATGTIAGQPNDPIATFQISVPVNERSDNLHGLELNAQHMFGETGYGLSANYTFVRSGLQYDNSSLKQQFALVGVSNSANLVGFYENERFSARAAYNWRGEFLASTNDGSGPNPMYTEPYGQLDMNFGYKWSKNLSFQVELINLNDGIQRLHGRTHEEVNFVTQTGRRYVVGARYKF